MEPHCTLEIRALPNAPRDEVVGWMSDVLKVRVRAPALDGRANDALCRFLAGELGLPRSAVTLHAGPKSRNKVVRIAGLDGAAVRTRLGS